MEVLPVKINMILAKKLYNYKINQEIIIYYPYKI